MDINSIVSLLAEYPEIEILGSDGGRDAVMWYDRKMAYIEFKYGSGTYGNGSKSVKEIAEFVNNMAKALQLGHNSHWCYDCSVTMEWVGMNPENDINPSIVIGMWPSNFDDVYACLKQFLSHQEHSLSSTVCK